MAMDKKISKKLEQLLEDKKQFMRIIAEELNVESVTEKHRKFNIVFERAWAPKKEKMWIEDRRGTLLISL